VDTGSKIEITKTVVISWGKGGQKKEGEKQGRAGKENFWEKTKHL